MATTKLWGALSFTAYPLWMRGSRREILPDAKKSRRREGNALPYPETQRELFTFSRMVRRYVCSLVTAAHIGGKEFSTEAL